MESDVPKQGQRGGKEKSECEAEAYLLGRSSMAGFEVIIYGRFWVITEDVAGTRDWLKQALVQRIDFQTGIMEHPDGAWLLGL